MANRNLLRISDAATLAIHALALLADADRPVQVARIAAPMRASAAHLGKVLQRLGKLGLVTSIRGPRGGFTLTHPASETRLLDVLIAVDGPITEEGCLLHRPACHHPDGCPVRGLNNQVRDLVVNSLSGLTLADIDLSDLLQETS
jgi:Rrf2 family protein